MVSQCLRLCLSAILMVLLSSFASRAAQDTNNPSPSKTGIDEQCISNLRQVYKLLKLHLHHSAGVLGFPSNFEYLFGMSKDQQVFICPGDRQMNGAMKTDAFQTSYEFVNDPSKRMLSTTLPGRIAIVAEQRPNHNGRRFVLFYDGSVRAFDKTEFDELKNNAFVDDACRYIRSRSSLSGYETGGPYTLDDLNLTKGRSDLREFLWKHWHDHKKGVAEAQFPTIDAGISKVLYLVQPDAQGNWGIDVGRSDRPFPPCVTSRADSLVRLPIDDPMENYPSRKQTVGDWPRDEIPKKRLADSEVKDSKLYRVVLTRDNKRVDDAI
jgi:hypothetical protein